MIPDQNGCDDYAACTIVTSICADNARDPPGFWLSVRESVHPDIGMFMETTRTQTKMNGRLGILLIETDGSAWVRVCMDGPTMEREYDGWFQRNVMRGTTEVVDLVMVVEAVG